MVEDKSSREHSVLKAIVDAEFVYRRQDSSPHAHPRVVTLSRDYGAGGNDVARVLGQQLGLEVYDREILDSIADASKVDSKLMEELDEKVRADRGSAWIRSIFTTNTAFPESYRYHLVNVLLGICDVGGIIVGRGAHIVLATRPVFRVRVVGSVKNCAERVAAREHIPADEALERVMTVNEERDDYLWKMFNRRHADATQFDLIVNTDRFSSVEGVALVIMSAMEQSSYLTQSTINN